LKTQKRIDSDSIAAMLPDGRLVPLDSSGGTEGLRGLHAGTGEGREVYRRGLILALDMAVSRIYPGSVLWVEHSISLGYRCRLENRPELDTDAIVDRLADELRRVVDEAIPIESLEIPSSDASLRLPPEFIRLTGWTSGERTIRCNLLGGSCAFAMGPAVSDTSWLTKWELRPQGQDFVLRFPGSGSWPDISPWKPRTKLAQEFDLEEQHCARMRVQDFDRLNQRIGEDGGRQVVLMSHFYQTYRMVEIVKELEEAFPERRIITIAGPSSSGKTTFAGLLSTYLSAQGFGARVINVDNYFHNRSQTPLGPGGRPDFESIDAIHTELFGRHLAMLLEQGEAMTPVFDFRNGVRNDDMQRMTLGASDFLIVEGIHGLNDALTPGIDPSRKFRIYASALTQLNIDRLTRVSTSDSRLVRRMVRDSTQRGYTAEETIVAWPDVNRGERMNIFAFQEEADAMFNSSLPYELPVLKTFAEPLLKTVPPGSPAYHTAYRLLDMFSCLRPIDPALVPGTSLLREFIGGSILERRDP
jgi:uridine kinase